MSTTTYENKCAILADVWLNYRNDTQFEDFIEYNDMGLPLAYAVAEGIVKSTELAEVFVQETFSLLIAGLAIEDTGFESLDDILAISE
jgi:hypothetical protein